MQGGTGGWWNAVATKILHYDGIPGLGNQVADKIEIWAYTALITLSQNTVDEKAIVGTTIGTLSTGDPDAASTTFTYSVSDTTNFQIDGVILKSNAVFNYEAFNSYTIDITSTDGFLTHTSTFTISVNEVPVANICFPVNTLVSTDQGEIEIEKLIPGVNTIDNKKIVTVTKTAMADDKLVLIKKNTLSKNIPNKDTTISGFHKIKHNGKLIEAYKLVNFYKDIKYIPYKGEVLYNVLMENWETMKVHNMEVETLHPDNIIAKLHNSKLSESQKLEIQKEISSAVNNQDIEKFDLIKNNILK